jgi:DNA-binding MarR family transcriptional regulator
MEQIDNLTLLRQLFRCSHQLHLAQKYRGQSRLLILLLENGALTQRELIEITGRRSATLSEQLASMETAGYVTRSANAADRRNVDIALTPLGHRTALDAAQARAQLADAVFAGYSAEEKQTLSRFLREIAQTLEARKSDADSGEA